MGVMEVRQKLYDDYRFYAKHCIKIRTKDAKILPFVLNAAQEKLHAAIEQQRRTTGKVRIVILKARQQGFSTYVHGRLYWKLSQRKGRKGLVVAHVADSTKTLFDMYKRTHAQCPPAMQMGTKYSSRKELVFADLDTGIMVATAGGDGIVRGETINDAHLSEVAFWPTNTAADNLNGLLQGIPNEDDTDVYVESTANGMSGVFYDLWKGALDGTNGFIPFFSPWFDSPEYSEPSPLPFERTLEEDDLVAQYGLTDGQLRFRRTKIAQVGVEKFKQEFPSNADEAFIASGRPVFDPAQIYRMLQSASEPIQRFAHEPPSFGVNARGELRVWKERDNKGSGQYWIGADVGQGVRNGDYSTASVLDEDKNLVAVWRGLYHPDYFADVLYDLGMFYNGAQICVENNNHGILTAVRLGRDLAYPDVYTEITEGKMEDSYGIQIGFRTTERTKPLIIDKLRASLRKGEMTINCRDTLGEMLTYVLNEAGKMTAEAGCHDDLVISLALANHIHLGVGKPIEVTDDWYVPSI